ncbi:hypothetical protein FB45DRAFT_167937 [Roridomyces roridus]|uniref:Uncharacterized protein n=1 Tax=Roridomyces roridus TaxID=1738132 RepID=A0AAD7BE95_9AGAR|nr:hypothetical protein FB45DRAFT_167937 [Roridomyces roridus]
MADNSSTAGLVASPSPISGSESVAESKGIFSPADSTFKPSPYYHPAKALSQPPKAAAPAAAKPIAPLHEVQHPTDPGMLIHPPFDDLPDNVVLTAEGMNYSVMHQHPTWFLDIKDYITLDSSPEGALRYPRDLEPPRPRRQKDLLLRCTFCPRTYAGVNAKSMWTRHVREKHRVILSKAWSDTTTSARRAPSAAAKAATQPADTASLQPGSISAAGGI